MIDATDILKQADQHMMPMYAVIGVVVVAQFGTIITVIIWLMKSVWWAAQTDLLTKQNTKDIDAAHKKLRIDEEAKNGSEQKP